MSEHRNCRGIASSLFSSAPSLGAGLFLLYFCQTIVYLAQLILLFYFEDRWAYRIGISAPAGWLVLAFATGLLGAATRQLRLEQGQGLANLVSFLAVVAILLRVAMMAVCARRCHREYGDLGKSLTTFAVSFGIVVVCYGILVVWFWHMIPIVAAHI
jgi:hypothetical protein